MKYITSNIPTKAGGLHNVCVRLGLRLMGIVDTIPKTQDKNRQNEQRHLVLVKQTTLYLTTVDAVIQLA